MNHDSGKDVELFLRKLMGCQHRIYAFILAQVHNWSDANDLMQEVTAVMWRKYDQYDSNHDFAAWGFGIANLQILSFRRTQYRSRVQFDSELLEHIQGGALSLYDNLDDQMSALKECREKLNEQDRELLKARYEDNTPVQDIASRFGKSLRSTYREITRIHQKLMRCVSKVMGGSGSYVESPSQESQPSAPLDSFESLQQEFELAGWITLLLDNKLPQEEFRKLQSLLVHKSSANAFYLRYIAVCVGLRQVTSFAEQAESSEDGPEEAEEPNILAEIIQRDQAQQMLIDQQREEQLKRERAIEAVLGTRKESQDTQRKALKLSSIGRVFGAIAAIVAVAILLTILERLVQVDPNASKVTYVATLKEQVNPRWIDDQGYEVGDSISSGSFTLVSGMVRLQFDDGADVIIEGPADLRLESSNDIYMFNGKLVAYAPDTALGFTVRTHSSKIVDLGTEFGVMADPTGKTEVSVFDGKVSLVSGWKSGGSGSTVTKTIKLKQGQARIVNSNCTINNSSVDYSLFVRRIDFDNYRKATEGSAYHRWLVHSKKLRNDPDLVAYYTFDMDEDNPQELTNVAGLTSDRLHGELAEGESSPEWVTGRWQEKRALDFNRYKQQSVTVKADPAFCLAGKVTVAAWINCPYDIKGGLLVSNREGTRVNYQVGIFGDDRDAAKKSSIQFARYKDDSARSHIYSRAYSKFPTGWNLFCVTHDNNKVKYYINGKLYDTRERKFEASPELADLLIGATDVPGYTQQIFNGIIDELMIYKKELTLEEIERLYQAGKL